MELQSLLGMLISLVLVATLGIFLRLYKVLVMEPKRVRSILRNQGMDGPPPKFILGNLQEYRKTREPQKSKSIITEGQLDHNYIAAMLPCFEEWKRQYGDLFTFSLGNKIILFVQQPNLVNEIITCTSLKLGKTSFLSKEFGPLFGNGILASNGLTWLYQRKVLAPELYMEKIKGMTNLISKSIELLLDSWKSKIDSEGGIADFDVEGHLKMFAGDVISRACFGSNYVGGKGIFQRLQTLQETSFDDFSSVGIPGTSYIPTKSKRESWKLEKEIRSLILQVVEERKESGAQNDLLQKIIEGAENGELSRDETDKFIVDNCKNIYLAGNESTGNTASWCLMLLAKNTEWQTRVRDEVLEICGGAIPDNDALRKMKKLTMVLQETLRLYPPSYVLSRETMKDVTIGGINVPKGVDIWTVVSLLHTDQEMWGSDSLSFNPERFVDGVSGACKLPQSFFPFGFGPRICAGQHLAMLSLKMIIASLVSNFSFTLSPNYVHSPVLKFVTKPGFGMNLVVKKLYDL